MTCQELFEIYTRLAAIRRHARNIRMTAGPSPIGTEAYYLLEEEKGIVEILKTAWGGEIVPTPPPTKLPIYRCTACKSITSVPAPFKFTHCPVCQNRTYAQLTGTPDGKTNSGEGFC